VRSPIRLASRFACFGLWAASGIASAMEQCRSPDGLPTRPCATPMQLLLMLVLPVLLAAGAVVAARRRIERPWLRVLIVGAAIFLCVAWELLAIAALIGFVAPCSATCWY